MLRSTNKNWKEVNCNKSRETLQPNDDYVSIPMRIPLTKATTSNRIKCDISKESNLRQLSKNNMNTNRKHTVVKPKKTVKSVSNFCKQYTKTPVQSEKCADNKKLSDSSDEQKCDLNQQINTAVGNKKKSLLSYYKNDNFDFISNSAQKVNSSSFKDESRLLDADSNLRADKIKFRENLDTIYSEDLSEMQSTSSEDILKEENLGKLKEFREKNYFECHSISRTKDKASTVAPGHKCSYRFYLNERLFPVPICTDYNNTIRCTECYLPMKFNKRNGRINLENDENLNGTIQAKVALDNNSNQDLTILLPVKETLIIPERRKSNVCRVDDEKFYFGIIQLNSSEKCFLNKNCPTDSLALRYQKGYREPSNYECYRYKKNEEFEFINV